MMWAFLWIRTNNYLSLKLTIGREAINIINVNGITCRILNKFEREVLGRF